MVFLFIIFTAITFLSSATPPFGQSHASSGEENDKAATQGQRCWVFVEECGVEDKGEHDVDVSHERRRGGIFQLEAAVETQAAEYAA